VQNFIAMSKTVAKMWQFFSQTAGVRHLGCKNNQLFNFWSDADLHCASPTKFHRNSINSCIDRTFLFFDGFSGKRLFRPPYWNKLKKTERNPTFANWLFAQTTHVVTAPC